MLRTLAQKITIGDGATSYTIDNEQFSGLYGTDITTFVTRALPYAFAIAGVGLLIMIILAGFSLMTSGGDAKKMEAGKNRLTYAIVGFIIVFSAYWIVSLLGIAFGISGIQQTFK